MDSGSFGRFQLIEEVGRGGMGTVYKAYDSQMKRDVAIKVLPETLAADSSYTERFRREAYAAGRLSEPHILPIYEAGELNGRLYLVMPFIRGSDLQHLLENGGPMKPARAVNIIDQIGTALDAARDAGLTHRDVKPSNILVTSRDIAYLIDFGIAHDVDSTRMTSTGTTIGTWGYMAPERFSADKAADSRADVYSLACVLFECLTGKQPFPGHSMPQQVHGHCYLEPPRPSAFVNGSPPALDSVIAKGMAKDPAERYQTGCELAAAARIAMATADALPSIRQVDAATSAPAAQPTMPASIYSETLRRAETPIATPANNAANEQPVEKDLIGWLNQFPMKFQAIAFAVLIFSSLSIYLNVNLATRQSYSRAGTFSFWVLPALLCGLLLLVVLGLVSIDRYRRDRALFVAGVTLIAETLVNGSLAFRELSGAKGTSDAWVVILSVFIPYGYVVAWGLARRQNQSWWKYGVPLTLLTVILRMAILGSGPSLDGSAAVHAVAQWLAFPGVTIISCMICWWADRSADGQRIYAMLNSAGFTRPDDGAEDLFEYVAEAYDYLCENRLVSPERALNAVVTRWPSVRDHSFT